MRRAGELAKPVTKNCQIPIVFDPCSKLAIPSTRSLQQKNLMRHCQYNLCRGHEALSAFQFGYVVRVSKVHGLPDFALIFEACLASECLGSWRWILKKHFHVLHCHLVEYRSSAQACVTPLGRSIGPSSQARAMLTCGEMIGHSA